MNPTPDQQQGDPIAVILARMEVKLDNALTEQARHSTTLDRHDGRIGGAEDRLTVLESTRPTNDQVRAIVSESKPKNVAAWVGVVVAGLAVVAAYAALFVR